MSSALVWDVNWAWSLPLVVFTVIFHATGLGLISRGVSLAIAVVAIRRHLPMRRAWPPEAHVTGRLTPT